MNVIMIFKYGKQFRFAPSFNYQFKDYILPSLEKNLRILSSSSACGGPAEGGRQNFKLFRTCHPSMLVLTLPVTGGPQLQRWTGVSVTMRYTYIL